MTAPDGQASDRTAGAVRALAADVEEIKRLLETLTARVDAANALAANANRAVMAMAQIVEGLRRHAEPDAEPGEEEPEPVPPWLVAEDVDTARADLADLVEWLGEVYVHYHGGDLPSCWMWHPGVIAELSALRDAWRAAVDGPRASPVALMDWHDRWRPGVARRVRDELSRCYLDQHTLTGDKAYRPPRVRCTDLGDEIAQWWVRTHGSSSAPPPTAGMLAADRADLAGGDRY